jgi:hypothetical protein
VVELPRRDPVEEGRVLNRVRIADLMRPDEEGLVVPLVARAPDETVERALEPDGQLDLDRSLRKREIREHNRRAVCDDARAAEVSRRSVFDVFPAPGTGIERHEQVRLPTLRARLC